MEGIIFIDTNNDDVSCKCKICCNNQYSVYNFITQVLLSQDYDELTQIESYDIFSGDDDESYLIG